MENPYSYLVLCILIIYGIWYIFKAYTNLYPIQKPINKKINGYYNVEWRYNK